METIEKSKLKELYEIKKIEKKGKKVTGIGYDSETRNPIYFYSEDGKNIDIIEKQDDESVELFRSSWVVDRYFWEKISLKERKERSLDRFNTL